MSYGIKWALGSANLHAITSTISTALWNASVAPGTFGIWYDDIKYDT